MWIYPTEHHAIEEPSDGVAVPFSPKTVPVHFSEEPSASKKTPVFEAPKHSEFRGITPVPHPPKAKQTKEPAPSPKEPPEPLHTAKTAAPSAFAYNNFQSAEKKKPARLFAGLYAFGALLSGILYRSLSPEQLAFLQLFVEKLQSAQSKPPFELFGELFLAAALPLIGVWFISFCAFGLPLLNLVALFTGVGNGLLWTEYLLPIASREVPLFSLYLVVYQAAVSAAICLLCQKGSGISSQLFSSAFSVSSKTPQIKTDTLELLRRYLYTVVVLVLLCGICAAASGLFSAN